MVMEKLDNRSRKQVWNYTHKRNVSRADAQKQRNKTRNCILLYVSLIIWKCLDLVFLEFEIFSNININVKKEVTERPDIGMM